jgi:hypothetical protein
MVHNASGHRDRLLRDGPDPAFRTRLTGKAASGPTMEAPSLSVSNLTEERREPAPLLAFELTDASA